MIPTVLSQLCMKNAVMIQGSLWFAVNICARGANTRRGRDGHKVHLSRTKLTIPAVCRNAVLLKVLPNLDDLIFRRERGPSRLRKRFLRGEPWRCDKNAPG